MRTLLILAICLAGAFMAGWFKISRHGDQMTIEIDRGEIRREIEHAVSQGRDFLEHELREFDEPNGATYPEDRYSDDRYGDGYQTWPAYEDAPYAERSRHDGDLAGDRYPASQFDYQAPPSDSTYTYPPPRTYEW